MNKLKIQKERNLIIEEKVKLLEKEIEILEKKIKLLENTIELLGLLNKKEYIPYYPPAIVPTTLPGIYYPPITYWYNCNSIKLNRADFEC